MFALGALLFSSTMGGVSYYITRRVLLSDQTSNSLRQAYANASLVLNDLPTTTQPYSFIYTLDSGVQSHSVLYVSGSWYSSSISVNQTSIPKSLRTMVSTGSPAIQGITANESTPEIVVGVPLKAVGAQYFEIFNVSDLAHTLDVLALALFAAGAITTVLGAVIGRWAAGRSLRPLTTVSTAAVAIADGRLDTRLPSAEDDPSLVGLTSSFNRMVDQLQERIERDARFTSDVSHELRSPLTTLAATFDYLEANSEELSPRARQALTLLGADLQRFQRMVRDLLEISRADTSSDISLEEVRVGELVRNAVASSLRSLPDPGEPPEIAIDPAVEDGILAIDKRRFERIVANLLENASLYGGGAARVSATGHGDGDDRTVRIAVSDNGPGVSPTERQRIFERFYRGQASGRRGTGTGTGLGLALVAEHVRLHHGRVWVEDGAAGGATFVIELPLLADGPEDHGAHETVSEEAGPREVSSAAFDADDRAQGATSRPDGMASQPNGTAVAPTPGPRP
jgi:signal transduction histidine kinase